MIALLFMAAAIAFLIMCALWAVQRATGNAGIVDVGWSASVPLLALFYFVALQGWDSTRAIIAIIMALCWGIRLAWHIHRRSHGKPEDARYTDLRHSWGNAFQWKIFIFFQAQAVAAVIFSIPFLIPVFGDSINKSGAPHALSVIEIIGAAIWLLAWLGESAADRQLNRFKANPANKGRVCEYGWWNYSRHPNYFFEWLIWVGLAVYCWPSPLGAVALVCPLFMLFFLFKLTGIPATEEQALKSKGEAYRHYQQTTSVFVPWFKKAA